MKTTPIKGYTAKEKSIIEDYILALDRIHHINGVISFEQDGNAILKKAFGFSNFEYSLPNSLETKFLLGSNTKLFTAVAVMQLIEKGHLVLNTPIKRFFPNHENQIDDAVTIHHLLSHTGGIINFFDMEKSEEMQYMEIEEEPLLNALFRESHMVLDEYHYSNSGYYLLGLIIEKITGLTYSNYVSYNIFDPLGMRDTGVYDQNSIVERIAYGYKLKEMGMISAPYFAMGKFHACGGIYSTVYDVQKWLSGLSSSQILSSDSFCKICTPVNENYGYGCRISETGGVPYIWHDGFIKGHYSHMRFYPSQGIHMQILRNSSAYSSHKPDELNPNCLCSEIAKILFSF